MSTEERVASFIGRAVDVYEEVLEEPVRRMGLESTTQRAFFGALSVVAPSQTEIRVDGFTASIATPTGRTYAITKFGNRVDDLLQATLRDLLPNLRPDDVFFDIGANAGLYSAFAANVISDGLVVGIEPNPRNAEWVAANLSLSDCEGVVYRNALWSDERELKLEVEPQAASGAGAYGSAMYSYESDEYMEVQAVSGDRLREEEDLPVPNVVKIDVEGADVPVLRGLNETLSSEECRLVYCNVVRSEEGDRLPEVRSVLEDYGFDVEPLKHWRSGREGVYLRAEKPTQGDTVSSDV